MKIEQLVHQIQQIDANLSWQANKAVNQMLTLRNWLIGYYIVEFEQNGEERAALNSLRFFSHRLKN